MSSLRAHPPEDLLLIPDGLYRFADARTVMADGDAAIFHKLIRSTMLDIEFQTTRPCLAFVLRGRERFTAPDHDRITVTGGELLFMPRDFYMVSDFSAADGVLEAFLFFFDAPVIEAFLHRTPIQSPAATEDQVRPFKIAADPTVSAYMTALHAVYHDITGNRDLLQTKLLELLLLLDATGDRARLRGFLARIGADAAKRNIRHLMKHPQVHRLGVKELADLSGRSPARFTRDFKRQFGLPPGRWLIEAKMLRARDLIRDGKMSVGEVALEVGYENASHFIKNFKSRFGTTPNQMRGEEGF